jgi:hypothetical protein
MAIEGVEIQNAEGMGQVGEQEMKQSTAEQAAGLPGFDPRNDVAAPAALQAELDKLYADPLYAGRAALADPKSPERKVLMARVQELRDRIAGEASQQVREKLPEGERPTEVLPSGQVPQNWDRESEIAVRDIAQSMGAPADMINEAVSVVAKGGYANQYEDYDSAVAALQKEWKDDYDARLHFANFAYSQLPKELQNYIQRSNLDKNTSLMTYLSDLGEKWSATDEAINALHRDERYTNLSHPDHRVAVAEITRLTKIRYPMSKA